MCMEGNIMSAEKWRQSMGRKARCMICGETVKGYDAALIMREQRERMSMVKSSRKAWDEGIRAETILAKADVYIAPDYSKILHYTVDPMHRQYGIGVREKSVVPAMIWGIVAALVVVAVSVVLS